MGGQQHPGERPDDTGRAPAGPVNPGLKHRHTDQSSLLGTHLGPRLSPPSRVPFPLLQPASWSRYDYLITQKKKTLPLGSGSCLGFLAVLNSVLTTDPFCHGLFIPFAAVPSKEGPGPTQKHTQLCKPPTPATFPSRAYPWAVLKEMWLTDLHLVPGRTPNWTRNAFPPRSPAPGMLAAPVRQVCSPGDRPSLRSPLLTAPLPFVNLFPKPTKAAPSQSGPRSSLSWKFYGT